MKQWILIISCLFLMGCALLSQSSKETALPAESQDEEDQAYTLSIKAGQEQLPDHQKIIILEQTETTQTEFTLQEVQQQLLKMRFQLEQLLFVYNLIVDRLLEIHERPDLPHLEHIPEKATLYYHIPLQVHE